MSGSDKEDGLRQLEVFLAPRIKAAHGESVNKSVVQIVEEVHKDMQ